ncbi:I78 family peptidase inhibitor [Rhodovulum sp. 12E13]|uniref:I78 family peptidase inhibitor n=1 Tax=Rhodovulum sp. 12E13 TaxID=2203891 RepID=UPI0018F77526|nr:I78 family peptidase inhibitor [Rhodovulum sp. 12E13]
MRRAMAVRGSVVAGCLWLAACGPQQPPFEEVMTPDASASLPAAEPVTAAPLEGDGDTEGGSGVVTAQGPGGLVERLPDTCQLDNYRQYAGQDAVTASFAVTDRPVRIIAPDSIVSQVYDPQRVNFYTDSAGRVARISCG